MKLALFGYGAMGQLVAAGARKGGDEIGGVFTSNDGELPVDQLAEKLRGHDVAIDFSIGDAVIKNVEACARAHVALVEGATLSGVMARSRKVFYPLDLRDAPTSRRIHRTNVAW